MNPRPRIEYIAAIAQDARPVLLPTMADSPERPPTAYATSRVYGHGYADNPYTKPDNGYAPPHTAELPKTPHKAHPLNPPAKLDGT